MKTETLIVLAAAAAGLYMVARATRAVVSAGAAPVTQVQNTALPGDNGWGWQYYSDGTAIGPDGSYYKDGRKVWSAT